MMIRTAGGPGAVSPLDFNERKPPRLSRAGWTAIGLVAAAHVGVGVALYHQRFELAPPIAQPDDGFEVTIERRPTPPPPKPETEPRPTKANPPLNPVSTVVESEVEPLPAEVFDNPSRETTTVLEFDRPVEPPARDVPPAQPEPPVRVIRNPSWISQPSGDQLMRAYPDRALERGLAGAATLNCMVEANGTVSGCSIISETPEGNGFGRAAQQLSRHFRINPRTVDGAAEGSRVSINLRFVPPAD